MKYVQVIMADKKYIRKDFSLCSIRHKRRIVQHYLRDVESRSNHSRQSPENEIGQRTDAESIITINQHPAQSHSVECDSESDNELNSSQEVYESCDEVSCTDNDNFTNSDSNESDEELHQFVYEDNDYYHCVFDENSFSDESDNVVDYNEPDSKSLKTDLSN